MDWTLRKMGNKNYSNALYGIWYVWTWKCRWLHRFARSYIYWGVNSTCTIVGGVIITKKHLVDDVLPNKGGKDVNLWAWASEHGRIFSEILSWCWQNIWKILFDTWDIIFGDVDEYFTMCSWMKYIQGWKFGW